jgi:hypothetical protein
VSWFLFVAEEHRRNRRGAGDTDTAVAVQQHLFLTNLVTAARHEKPGLYTARLAAAGSAFLLPDLVQNIIDRPLVEVLDFLDKLEGLPMRPSMESLTNVFGWYQDGFLDNMPYEEDPVGAWAKCAIPTILLLPFRMRGTRCVPVF